MTRGRDGKNANLITSMAGLGMNVNRSRLVKLIGDTKQYMSQEMIKNGHHQDPTCGIFFARPIGDRNEKRIITYLNI